MCDHDVLAQPNASQKVREAIARDGGVVLRKGLAWRGVAIWRGMASPSEKCPQHTRIVSRRRSRERIKTVSVVCRCHRLPGVEFREILARRRMVRHYAPESASRESLERIVSTVRRAPSAGFSQGQRLLVVTDQDLLAALAALESRDSPEAVEPWLATAAAHVLVLTREEDYHDRYRQPDKLRDGTEIEWPVPFWFVDAGAALMLVLLAAVDEGLAAGVYGVSVESEATVRSLLGIPDDLKVVAGVTVGAAAPDPGWSRITSRATRPRRRLEELVRWQRWTS